MEFLVWLRGLPLSEWIGTSDWIYPILLSAHSVGMATVVGLLVMLDIRVLFPRKDIAPKMLRRLTPLIWVGFWINAASGILLFMSNADRLIVNWPFQMKMACVAIGGLLTWGIWRSMQLPLPGSGAAPAEPSTVTKILAAASIVVWFLAILGGRLIAYVLDASLLRVQ